MRLFKRYRELCPNDAPSHAFYLQPSRTPTDTCWYTRCPVGHNTLSTAVARMCKLAGITGYKTNHSLRATATSRLYQSGVDEQLVMERTGHRSVEGVRSYKRTSDKQRETLSNILNRTESGPSTASNISTGKSLVQQIQPLAHSCARPCIDGTHTFQSAQLSQQLHAFSLPSATFKDCNINFYVGSPPHHQEAKPRKRRAIIDSDSD